EVARWTLPVDTEENWQNNGKDRCCLETFSTHYFRLVDHTLFVAMYHAGLWAVDLTDPATPHSVGVFVPDRAPPDPRREPVGGYDLTPFILDVFPQADYSLTVFDAYSGVYSLKFDPTKPAPAVPEWPQAGGTHADG
ncbi:MAG TPA: hypothetical protein VM370_11485, partial [Candidatus Thermoplasmatota archaeon]|nr:hypothetical protein [Candidatus Thermoplasmatota archaeon]